MQSLHWRHRSVAKRGQAGGHLRPTPGPSDGNAHAPARTTVGKTLSAVVLRPPRRHHPAALAHPWPLVAVRRDRRVSAAQRRHAGLRVRHRRAGLSSGRLPDRPAGLGRDTGIGPAADRGQSSLGRAGCAGAAGRGRTGASRCEDHRQRRAVAARAAVRPAVAGARVRRQRRCRQPARHRSGAGGGAVRHRVSGGRGLAARAARRARQPLASGLRALRAQGRRAGVAGADRHPQLGAVLRRLRAVQTGCDRAAGPRNVFASRPAHRAARRSGAAARSRTRERTAAAGGAARAVRAGPPSQHALRARAAAGADRACAAGAGGRGDRVAGHHRRSQGNPACQDCAGHRA